MRIVLDTNVVMSAIFFGGIPDTILTSGITGKFTPVISPRILDEYQQVAKRLSKKFPVEYDETFEWITVRSEMVEDVMLEEQICDDPDDDKFIAVALASKAKLICSGDKHLLRMDGYCGIEVLKPKPFADKYL